MSNNIEINSIHAGKGKALHALCRHLGLDPAETLAFGDGSNDLELLQMAGLGVAMANAQEPVLRMADAVAGNNNEGGLGKMLRSLMKA